MIDIIADLFRCQDSEYKLNRCSTIPTIDPDTVIGVKYDDLHILGDRLFKCGEAPEFMRCLPHKYFEENCLHAYLINKIGCFDECVSELIRFLPYIDNWFICDMIHPNVFKRYHDDAFLYVCDWLKSDKPFTQRVALNTMTDVFSKELYDKSHIRMINEVYVSDDYVMLAKARYFAELLVYHYDDMMMYIYFRKLDLKVHNETIAKALDSSRISEKQKLHLKELKL